jgi:Fe-S cluster assembly iron-binding protein IscA
MLEVTTRAKAKLKEFLGNRKTASPIRIMATVGG